MKIRIQDGSIRYRLSKSDLKKLYKSGKIVSKCRVDSSNVFKYSIKAEKDGNTESICVDLKPNHMVVKLSKADVKEWYKTDLLGFDSVMDNDTKDGLSLIIEKDFACLKDRGEDESDMYDNPLAE